MSEPRKILHLDLDAFFCAVEAQRDPTLRGLPFAAGGRPESAAWCPLAPTLRGVDMTGNISSIPGETGDGLATVKTHRPGTRKSRTTVEQEPPMIPKTAENAEKR